MTMLPKISVVIPVYNNANTIERAILSVLDQKYRNLELIVIDGGSSDGTVDVIKQYEKYISYWHSKRDGSCGLAINMGLEKATGIITSQLMADDWFEQGIFLKIGKAYLENPDVDVISCGGRFVKYDSETKEYQTVTSYLNENEMQINVLNMCFGIPAMSSRFLTQRFIKRIGLLVPFDENGKHHYSADRELLLRAAVLGCKNIYIKQLGHSYFIHAGSATFGGDAKNRVRIYQEHMRWVDDYLAKYSLSSKDKSLLYVWYNDQSVKYFLQQMIDRNWRLALHTAYIGIKKTKWRWIIALISTPSGYLMRKLFNRNKFLLKLANKN